MTTSTTKKDIIKIADLTRESILELIDLATQLKTTPQPKLLENKILANCFFESSTRTRLSFETAMYRLGGAVTGFSDCVSISTNKGETLTDTICTIEKYADILVVRHPYEGAAQHAAKVSTKPVINAGDGSNQHPTQTLLDLFSIQECQGRLDELHIAIAGDLKHGRAVHSLVEALLYFNPRLYLVAPSTLELPKEICQKLKDHGIKYSYHTQFEDVLHKTDILYMTRLQKERLVASFDHKYCRLKLEHLETAKSTMKILHPLPRVDEVDFDIDDTSFAYYFKQAENGLYMRQALLATLLETHD